MTRAALMAAAVALAGCQHLAATQVQCLPLKAYSPADQLAIGAALSAVPDDAPLAQAMIDYEHMRDADRACLAAAPKP